jgi:RNA polymerase sigma-70 factor (ECF subfamily)
VLYYYIGLSYKEIGDILGISERAVEGRLYRAKQKLKVKLENGEVILWSNKGTI